MNRVQRIVRELEAHGWEVVRSKRHLVLKLGNHTLVLSKSPRNVDDMANIARQLDRRLSCPQ